MTLGSLTTRVSGVRSGLSVPSFAELFTRGERRAQLRTRDHLLTALFGTWLMIGLFVDGWAHINLKGLESFFTPWHGLFYSGFLACTLWTAWLTYRQLAAGRTGFDAIPRGYELGVVGLVVFFLGGNGDMVWHTIFGIEEELEALL